MARAKSTDVIEAYDFEVPISKAGTNSEVNIRTGSEFVEIRTAEISLSIAIDDHGRMRAYVFDTDGQKMLFHKPM